MKLFGLTNVYYEEQSDYDFEELNESLYIKKTIGELKDALGKRFFEFEFFIFSNHKVNKKNPGSERDTMPPSADVPSDKKKILLYFSDEGGLDPSFYADKYFAIFKAYIGTQFQTPNVFPLALGYVNSVPEFPDKKIKDRKFNVFFRGNLNMNRINFYRTFSKLGFLLPPEKWLTHDYYRKFLIKLKSDFSNFFNDSIIIFNSGFKAGYSPRNTARCWLIPKLSYVLKGIL